MEDFEREICPWELEDVLGLITPFNNLKSSSYSWLVVVLDGRTGHGGFVFCWSAGLRLWIVSCAA
jgi:hypothetical protein